VTARRREPVLLDLAALTTRDLAVLADAVIYASNHPNVSRRGGDALAQLADQLLVRSRRPTGRGAGSRRDQGPS
jgi:hypothetical protein